VQAVVLSDTSCSRIDSYDTIDDWWLLIFDFVPFLPKKIILLAVAKLTPVAACSN
jgi:hypothetical protein